MAGWAAIQLLRQLEGKAAELGLKFAQPRHAGGWPENQEYVALVPVDDQLPVYSRDAEVFVGSLADINNWLRGIEWARGYDKMLRVVDEKKRATGEQKYLAAVERERNRAEQKRIMKILKTEVIE
jgi:hypothetical protein